MTRSEIKVGMIVYLSQRSEQYEVLRIEPRKKYCVVAKHVPSGGVGYFQPSSLQTKRGGS